MTAVRAGVAGYPVKHSKSPFIHNYWLKKYKINAVYTAEEIHPEKLEDFFSSLSDNGFAGVNVTVPHKVETLKYMDVLSPEAQKAGAVNTVVVQKNGKLYGHNTDGFGFLANILEHKPGFDVQKRPVVVLGTGGAARGICAALVLAGVPEIRLVYRTKEKADALASAVGGNFSPVEWAGKEEALKGAGLLANATTLGMNGFDPLKISLENLSEDAVVSDLVYAPLETDLLKQARKKGIASADGLGMLLHQARPAFKAWFGIMPDITPELREGVLR